MIIQSKKNKYIFGGLLICCIFLLPEIVSANAITSVAKGVVATIIGGVIEIFVMGVGFLLNTVIWVLVQIANYDNFIKEPAVTLGWAQVRNLANMFFVVILLVIAFATILRVDSYNVKKLLPKLVIMAILINFSKMICGIIIEINQVVMMTFLNAVQGNGSGFINLLGVENFLKEAQSAKWDKGFNLTDSVVGYFLALIYLIIALMVVVAFLSVLVMRMIMLWVYIVLSPLAFLLSAFPQGQSYANRWWDDFTKYAVTGPVLAFFLWLAMASAGNTGEMVGDNTCMGPSNMVCTGPFLQFIIGIGMLIGGLQITAQIGGTVGGAASKALGRIQKGKDVAVGYAKDKTIGVAKGAGRIGLAGLSTVDRLAGRVVSSIPGASRNWGEKGLVNRAAQGVWNAPKNIFSNISDRFKSSDVNNKKRRSALYNEGTNGIVVDGGKSYRANSAGYYQEVDSTGAVNPLGDMMRDSNNELVKRMNGARAAMHDAWNGAQSGAQAASNKAQEERLDKIQKKFSDSNMTTEEMRRIYNDASTSRDTKMALAMTLAIKEGFRDKGEIDRGRAMLQGNNLLLKKYNDEVDKNQAHIAYDMTNTADRNKFKTKIDQGKIDSTKMKSAAYSDQNILSALEEYHGQDFNRVMESAFNRGKKYEDSVAQGLLAKRNTTSLNGDKAAKLHAKLTGDVAKSFNNGTSFDQAAFENYVSGAKAKDLNNIGATDFAALVTSDVNALNGMLNSVTYAKLKAMHKQGDNPDLVRHMRDQIMANSAYNPTAAATAGSILTDHELNSL